MAAPAPDSGLTRGPWTGSRRQRETEPLKTLLTLQVDQFQKYKHHHVGGLSLLMDLKKNSKPHLYTKDEKALPELRRSWNS